MDREKVCVLRLTVNTESGKKKRNRDEVSKRDQRKLHGYLLQIQQMEEKEKKKKTTVCCIEPFYNRYRQNHKLIKIVIRKKKMAQKRAKKSLVTNNQAVKTKKRYLFLFNY